MGHHSRFFAYAVTFTIVYASFLATVAVANVCSAKQDLTLKARSSGKKVVEAVVQKIQASRIFPDDNQFLRRIAYVESKDGRDERTYRTGYHGGIWQVDLKGFADTQATGSHEKLVARFKKIQEHFGIDWTTVTWQDLEKPLYSGLAARLFLVNEEDPIPSSSEIEKQAEYWKEHYNTKDGAGTIQKFIDDVSHLNNMTSEECKVKGSDVVFLLDSSGSIGATNFQKIKNFVVSVVNQFTIGPEDTRVGVIAFSSSPVTVFSLHEYNTAEEVILATQAIYYSRGGTNTASGLRNLVDEFVNNGRPTSLGIPKVAIVVTDGKSNNNEQTVLAAKNVHAYNIITYAVGIGDNVNQDELLAIAGSTGLVKNIEGFNVQELESLQSDLNQQACKASAISEIGEIITSTVGNDEAAYYQYNEFPGEGMTLKLCAKEGSVVMYATDKISNPSEALYDVRVETSSCTDVYINYDTLYGQCLPGRKKRQTLLAPDISNITLYVTIVGQFDTNNTFTFNTTYNDTSSQETSKMFQLKFGRVQNCASWTPEKTMILERDLKAAIVANIKELCSCTFDQMSIRNGSFSCYNSTSEVTYRANIIERISLAPQYSTLHLNYLKMWAESGVAFFVSESRKMWIDSECSVLIGSFGDFECESKQTLCCCN